MLLQRIIILAAVWESCLVVADTISCQNCTTSRTCNPSLSICASTTCFLVAESHGKYSTSGCATDLPDFTVNGTAQNGLCFHTENSTVSGCNNLMDSDKWPIVEKNPVPSIDYEAMIQLAKESPVTMAPVAAESTTPKSVALRNRNFVFSFFCLLKLFS